jgi:hypothetical protein
MKFGFLSDLDDYFCEVYANYDKLCVLPNYRMPKMQDTRVDEFGRKYAYTLPANTMRLAAQENKAELLQALKDKMTDKTFSFSFRPLGFFARIRETFAKVTFKKTLKEIAARYNLTLEQVGEGLEIDGELWKNIVKGKFYPSKNLVFSIALSSRFTYQETKTLLEVADYEFDYEEVKDTVVAYLLFKGIYNPDMVQAALDEYKIKNLFIKR